MADVEAKISAMNDGTHQLRASSQRLALIIRAVQNHIDALMAMGFSSPAAEEFIAQYHAQRTMMDELPHNLLQFALRLEEATAELLAATQAQPIESAVIAPIASPASAPLETIATPLVLASALTTPRYYYAYGRTTPKKEIPPTPTQHAISDYVNRVNRPLYEQWSSKYSELTRAQQALDDYTQERTTKTQELTALKNRILSLNPDADLNQVVRVKSLREDISQLDQHIHDTQADIATLQANVDALESRLSVVKPAPGADLHLIAQMEFAKTPDVVIQNTEDCVKYIVGKFAIPPNMATDAHLWNENVLRLTEYGMSVGDTPLVGSVLVMEREHSYAHDVYGHVMYVERVDTDGTVWITDNFHPDTPVRLMDITKETTGANISYVYFPWHTKI
jgi:hypothetical protein